jgi:hypothetical protein
MMENETSREFSATKIRPLENMENPAATKSPLRLTAEQPI